MNHAKITGHVKVKFCTKLSDHILHQEYHRSFAVLIINRFKMVLLWHDKQNNLVVVII